MLACAAGFAPIALAAASGTLVWLVLFTATFVRLPLEEPLHHQLTNASIVIARSGNALRTALSAVTKGTDSALASATNSAS
jgi:hypothetical protein